MSRVNEIGKEIKILEEKLEKSRNNVERSELKGKIDRLKEESISIRNSTEKTVNIQKDVPSRLDHVEKRNGATYLEGDSAVFAEI